MNIFKPLIASNYQFFETDTLEHLEMLQNRNYKDISLINFSIASVDREFLGDITIIDSSLLFAFSSRAKEAFKNDGRFISIDSLKCYSLFEPPVIDALDFDNSLIDYFSGTQKLKRIRKYMFLQEKIGANLSFVLPFKGSPMFVTEKFIAKYNKLGYNGLDFQLIAEC
ncbi:MAG: hypothetical protein IJP90_14935 [Treponema sp.]|nr:hypothetical protein [Treponema sp.]